MKTKIIIILSLILLLAVVFFMVNDFFYTEYAETNLYEYDLSDYQKVDKQDICYSEVDQLIPKLEKLKAIAVDNKDRIYVSGENKVAIYDKYGEEVQAFEITGDANCLSISETGEIYIGISDHVEVYDFSGNIINQWESPKDPFDNMAIWLGLQQPLKPSNCMLVFFQDDIRSPSSV